MQNNSLTEIQNGTFNSMTTTASILFMYNIISKKQSIAHSTTAYKLNMYKNSQLLTKITETRKIFLCLRSSFIENRVNQFKVQSN